MSDQYDALIAATEQKYGIPKGLLLAQKSAESGGDPRAVSKKGALGLMQFTPPTAKAYGVDPFDPVQAIDGAGRYMRDNLKAANGDPTEALRLYQGGPNRAGWGKENHAYPAAVYKKMGDEGVLTAMGLNGTPARAGRSEDDAVAAMGFGDAPAPAADQTAPSPQTAPQGAPQGAAAEIEAAVTGKPVVADGDLSAGLYPFLAKGDKAGALAFLRDKGQMPQDTKALDQGIAAAKAGNASVVVPHKPLPKVSDSTLENLKDGGEMGLRDVLQGGFGHATQWLDQHVPGVGAADQFMAGKLGPGLWNSGDQLASDYAQRRDMFDAGTGTTLAGGIGRFGGNMLATAPLMVGGGALLGAGGRLAAAALPEASAPLEFLAGNAGRAVGANGAAGTAAVPGNMLVRGASLAANGAVQGGTGAALTSAQSDAPLADQIENGMKLGAAVAPVAGAVGSIAGKLKDVVAPPLSEATANLADLALNKYGIQIRGSQISGNPLIRRWDLQRANSLLGDFAEQNAAQRGQFTRAVGRTFGADAEHLPPDVMAEAKNRIGNVYNDVAGRNNLDLNPESGSTFLDDITNAHSALNVGPQNAGRTDKLLDEVLAKVGPDGTISGHNFKTLTSRGSMLDTAANSSDPEYRAFAKQVRAGLNAELERVSSPEDVAKLKDADWQWKNMKTVEKLIANSPDKQFSPALLQRSVTGSFKNRAYTGAGDLGELGDIGQSVLKFPNSSGTAENLKAEKMASGGNLLAALGLGTLGHAVGLPMAVDVLGGLGMAGRGAIGAVGNSIAGRYLGTPVRANKLIQAALNDNGTAQTGLAGHYLPSAVVVGNRLLQPR